MEAGEEWRHGPSPARRAEPLSRVRSGGDGTSSAGPPPIAPGEDRRDAGNTRRVEVDAAGQVHRYTWDKRGRLVTTTNAAALTENLAAHRAADSTDAEFSRLDAAFHQLIVAAGRNGLLEDFFVSLGERHRRMTSASVDRDPAVAARILDDHAGLIAALVDGDADAFDTLLATHLAGVHGQQELDR